MQHKIQHLQDGLGYAVPLLAQDQHRLAGKDMLLQGHRPGCLLQPHQLVALHNNQACLKLCLLLKSPWTLYNCRLCDEQALWGSRYVEL